MARWGGKMDLLDLDALSPEPVRVRYRGKEYAVRRDIPTAQAVELMRLLLKVDALSRKAAQADDPAVVEELLALTAQVPAEAARLMTDDPDEQKRLGESLSLQAAREVLGLVLEQRREGNAGPPKAAKGAKGKKEA